MDESIQKQFSCLHCEYEPSSESEFYKHANVHKYQAKFKMKCFFCLSKFRKFSIHKRHVKKCGKNTQCNNTVSENVWQCQLCQDQITIKKEPNLGDYKKVSQHLAKHILKEDEMVCCPTCQASFQLYQSYVNHYNKHIVRDHL